MNRAAGFLLSATGPQQPVVRSCWHFHLMLQHECTWIQVREREGRHHQAMLGVGSSSCASRFAAAHSESSPC